ncbi:unnamed protein product [Owenia fusiformis]|uniref:Uncharacterized protein n=1 Tax=Owenia fusiformis TaxID=6347 RepID=A0A8J1XRF3_OWEFU|nr:unnamed protein product [Owenia fusiformis]
MDSMKIDVHWSPTNPDQFLTFGTDLRLYGVETIKDGSEIGPQGVQIGPDKCANLLAMNNEKQFIRCISWYRQAPPDPLIAVGLASGKVILSGFGKGIDDPLNLVGKEFVSNRHTRQCHCLAWNHVEKTLLAEGLDKYRMDPAILIWDVLAKPSGDLSVTPERKPVVMHHDPATVVTRPLYELGSGETCYSLDWIRNEPKTLLAGMNNKSLRIYDLRDSSKSQRVADAYTKAVHGIKVDPHCEHRLASFHESQIHVWDIRNFDKPMLTFSDQKPVMKISWCPTRTGLLASLVRDSSAVKLYDIQHTNIGTDDVEPTVIERYVQPGTPHSLSSFSWHNTCENRLITVSTSSALRDVTVFERIALKWCPNQYLMWSCGRKIQQLKTTQYIREAATDISITMKRRAMKEYGLQIEQLGQNGYLVGDNALLINLWGWLDYVNGLHNNGDLKVTKGSSKYMGVKSILLGEGTSNGLMSKSTLNYMVWQGLGSGKYGGSAPRTYSSEERSKALTLCSWGFEKDEMKLNAIIDRYESLNQFERAAAIALFNLKIRRAIQILNDGAMKSGSQGVNLNVVAMALSGFTDDKNTLWREMCSTSRSQLMNPYLRAMFAFLTGTHDNYEDVLQEEGLEVQDRVAFACTFLNDVKLAEYISDLTKSLTDAGNLDGILLTGLTKLGLELLQNYVDNTGDVQTAALVVIQAFPGDISKDQRVLTWIESYRDLLDQWKLWHQRAEFDVHRQKCDTGARPASQIFVSCNFCGKSIAYNMLAAGRRRHNYPSFGGSPTNKTKIESCPGCRKPLPRCALCLINMGTAAGSALAVPRDSTGENGKLTKLREWFTWCQTCRHGGHAEHITEWFKLHSECPVSGCQCKCFTLDTSLTSNTSSSTVMVNS